MSRILIAVLCTLLCTVIYAQEITRYTHEFIGPDEGLASRKVLSVTQDINGLMWVGTELGLHTFDGVEAIGVDKAIGLPTQPIERLFADSTGFLLIQTRKGLYVLDVNRRVLIGPGDGVPQDSLQYIEYCGISHRGTFLAKLMRGPLFEFRTDGWSRIPGTTNLTNRGSTGMPAVWFAYRTRFLKYMCDGYYYLFLSNRDVAGLRLDTSFAIVDSIILVKDDKGPFEPVTYGNLTGKEQIESYSHRQSFRRLSCFCNEEGEVALIPPHVGQIAMRGRDSTEWPRIKGASGFPPGKDQVSPQYLYGGNDSTVCFIYDNGLYSRNTRSGKTDIILNTRLRFVIDYYQDNTGIIWAPDFFGLHKIVPVRSSLQSYLMLSDPEPSYKHSVRSFFEITPGRLMLGAERNLVNVWDEQLREVVDTLEFPPRAIYDVERYDGDSLWLISEYGVYSYPQNPALWRGVPNGATQRRQYEFAEFENGNVMHVMGTGIIATFRKDERKWTVQEWEYQNARALHKNADGSFWLGHSAGLTRLNWDLEVLDHFDTSTDPQLSHAAVQHIYQDSAGLIWCSTRGGGVSILDLKNQTSTSITIADGLPNNTVYSTIPWGNYYLFPTDNGLAVYNKHTRFVYTYTTEDGLPHNEFNYPGHYISEAGNLYLGTLNGFVVIPPDIEFDKALDLQMFVTHLSAYNSRTEQVVTYQLNPTSGDPVMISPNEKNLSIRFGLADYSYPEGNRYMYRIKGYTNDWVSLGSSNSLNFASLPAGYHEVEVRAATARGGVNRNVLVIPLKVHRPFVETVWFYLLLVAAAAGIFYTLYRVRLAQIQKLVSVRQHIATNLHDEVGSTMTLIALESDLIQSDVYDDKTSAEKVQFIADKSREASKTMSDIVWSFDARQDFMRDLISRMQVHLSEMLGPGGVAYQFNKQGLNEEVKLDPLVRQNVYLIFKEAINNIVKHSNATEVQIELATSDNSLELSIRDNGSNEGTSNGVSSSGQGMLNMAMRAERIGGKLFVDGEDGFLVRLSGVRI